MRQVDVPEGKSGDWRIERFEVSKQDADFENLRAAIGGSSRPIRPGTYTRLMRGGSLVMSDTPMEMYDHAEAVRRARGRVLVGGLGLGMVVQAMLDMPDVEHVTVVELSDDVITLAGAHYLSRYPGRLNIVHDNMLTWRPAKTARYGAAWFDIWDGICSDNLPAMQTLRRRYARRAAWLGCWCYYETLRARR